MPTLLHHILHHRIGADLMRFFFSVKNWKSPYTSLHALRPFHQGKFSQLSLFIPSSFCLSQHHNPCMLKRVLIIVLKKHRRTEKLENNNADIRVISKGKATTKHNFSNIFEAYYVFAKAIFSYKYFCSHCAYMCADITNRREQRSLNM